jgi:hypothetical protein
MILFATALKIQRRSSITGNKKLFFFIFIFFLAVNLISAGGHFDWWDGVEAFLVTESMVLKHSAKLHPDVPSIKSLNFPVNYTVYVSKTLQTGKYYDEKTIQLEPVYTVRSLLLSAIAVPFYYAAIIFSASPISLVAMSVNPLLISLTCLVIFCFSSEIYASKKIAFILSLIFAVCSFVWAYNTTFWSQPLQALCLILSAYFIYISLHYHYSFICHYTRPNNNNSKGFYFAGLGGLFLGLSVFAHPTSIIIIPGFIAYSFFSMRHNRKSLSSFLMVLAIILFLIGFVNNWRFGSFTEFGYGVHESLSVHTGWKGLIGLLASPGGGLIFYFPISILLPLASKYMYRKNKGIFLLFAYVIIANWLNIGTLCCWEPYLWIGTGWGPRYLVPVLPFITILLGALLPHAKKRLFLKLSIIILCVAGFYVNLLGTLVWYQYGYAYGWEKEQLAKYDNHMDIIVWNLYYSPIILHMEALVSDYVSHIQPEKYLNTDWYWMANGLAPCSYDVYIFCKFGILPLLLLSAFISILAMLIMREIGVFNNAIQLFVLQLKSFASDRKIR